jgi:hypothetical protein
MTYNDHLLEVHDRDDYYDFIVSNTSDQREPTETEEIFGSEQAFWKWKEG